MKTVLLSLVLTLGLHSSLGMSATEIPETELNLEEVADADESQPAQTFEPEETTPSTSFWKRKSTWVAAAVVVLASYSLYSYKYKAADGDKSKNKPADEDDASAKKTWTELFAAVKAGVKARVGL